MINHTTIVVNGKNQGSVSITPPNGKSHNFILTFDDGNSSISIGLDQSAVNRLHIETLAAQTEADRSEHAALVAEYPTGE